MKEVSCRVLGIFFKEITKRGHSPELLMHGIPYSLAHLRNNEERIEWSAFVAFMHNVGKEWNDDGLERLGTKILDYPGMRSFVRVARLVLSVRDFYRWMTKDHGEGTGKQHFSCIRSHFRDIGANQIEIEIEIPKKYKTCREFFLVTKGFHREIPRVLGLKQANVHMEQLNSHSVRYHIDYPAEGRLLSSLRKAFASLLTSRSVAREYQQAQAVITEGISYPCWSPCAFSLSGRPSNYSSTLTRNHFTKSKRHATYLHLFSCPESGAGGYARMRC